MHIHPSDASHSHRFSGELEQENERRTLLVVGLTAMMMIAEIVAGTLTGSMGLLADGWHMGSHVAALGLAAFAYRFSRRHADSRCYSFGTGKVGPLAGFASALVLGLVALGMATESIHRLINPVGIDYSAAMLVAAIGLAVNLGSAMLLGGHHHHHHADQHCSDRHSHDHHHDHNLRAAHVHVLADVLTSLLAIVALAGGALFGLAWLDPVIGVGGAAVILCWSWGLVRSTSNVLLDAEADGTVADKIRTRLEREAGCRVVDLHLWQVGTGHLALIVSLVAHNPRPPRHYKRLLGEIDGLSHVTVEVLACCEPVPRAA
jgi:cation diffusion facilitator family transporter